MQHQTGYKLILSHGDPSQAGAYIYLEKPQTTIGRANSLSEPDFSIYNQFVSRQHCVIEATGKNITIKDLGSKHGTELNGIKLIPYESYPVQESDCITLANGLIELKVEKDLEETMELSSELLSYHFTQEKLQLDDISQTVRINSTDIKLSHKEYDCCKVLADHLGEFVPKEYIADRVWPERRLPNYAIYVGTEEINSLIYRLRTKTKGYLKIESILRKGFKMSLEE
jgi:DNA-binding winged helix-turn-helix (wHTH) protein